MLKELHSFGYVNIIRNWLMLSQSCWDVPKLRVSKLTINPESWWYGFSLSLRAEDQFFSVQPQPGREGKFSFTMPFYSIPAFNGLDENYLHWEGQSSLLSLQAQMLISFRNTPKILPYQISGHSMAQSRWHKINIKECILWNRAHYYDGNLSSDQYCRIIISFIFKFIFLLIQHKSKLYFLKAVVQLHYAFSGPHISDSWSANHFTHNLILIDFSSVEFSHSVVSDSLWPHESQHASPPCPSPTPGEYSNSCSLSWWCHPTISSSVIPISSCPQSLPASGSFAMSQLFAWGGQSTGVSASALVLTMSTQDWSALGWTGWISLQSKGLSRVFSKTTVQKHPFLWSTQSKALA